MKKVYFENLLAGALLKFDRISSIDIAVMINGILSIPGVVYSSETYNILEEYIIDEGAIISLKSKVYKPLLYEMQLNIVKQYFDSLNEELYVLRKLKLMGSTSKLEVENYFDSNQTDYFELLYIRGYINIENDNFIITKLGLIKLFLIDNKELLKIFKEIINKSNLDETLLDEYLNIQENFDDLNSIFNIVNYESFCNKFGNVLENVNKG